MKKIIFALITALLSSCSIYNFVQDKFTASQEAGHKLYYSSEFDTLTTYNKIANYITSKVTYDYEDDPADVKDPEVTLATGKGSCADAAVLFMNIAHFSMKQDMNLITTLVKTTSKSVVAGGTINHAAVEYDGQVINQYSGWQVVNWYPAYRYTFQEVFN